jgi:primase-polymerase (primpol)-like protein
LVNKDGQFKTRLPTQYRTNKSKKKILAKEGNKLDYQIIKCVVCAKKKMEKYNLMDEKGQFVTINKCKNCKYTNASVVTAFYESDGGDPYVINYFNPARLEDKS